MQTIQFRSSLFWDTNPKKLDTKRHAKYIIERIMDFGNDNEVRWMRQQYPRQLLARYAKPQKSYTKAAKLYGHY